MSTTVVREAYEVNCYPVDWFDVFRYLSRTESDSHALVIRLLQLWCFPCGLGQLHGFPRLRGESLHRSCRMLWAARDVFWRIVSVHACGTTHDRSELHHLNERLDRPTGCQYHHCREPYFHDYRPDVASSQLWGSELWQCLQYPRRNGAFDRNG